jgi:ADP-heptose:LPS heptosyltransferase
MAIDRDQGHIAAQLHPKARIIVVRLDGVGDCVLSAGFFVGLRDLFPDAHITALFREDAAPLYEASGLFDVIWKVSAMDGRLDGFPSQSYDLAICPRWDIDYWSARQLILRSNAPIRIGFDRPGYRHDDARDGRADRFFTDIVLTESARHEALKGHDLLRFLGAVTEPSLPRLFIPDAARIAARRFQRRFSLQRYAVLGISAGLPNRVWPVENFLPVIDEMAQSGLQCVVVGGADAEMPGRWLREMRSDSVVSGAGPLKIMESAAVIADAALYVGMDSGPMHMAAASGVPVVEISCHPLMGSIDHHNSPKRFGPFATPHRVVRPTRPARPLPLDEPCIYGCHRVDISHCIALVTGREVLGAIRSLQTELAGSAGECLERDG